MLSSHAYTLVLVHSFPAHLSSSQFCLTNDCTARLQGNFPFGFCYTSLLDQDRSGTKKAQDLQTQRKVGQKNGNTLWDWAKHRLSRPILISLALVVCRQHTHQSAWQWSKNWEICHSSSQKCPSRLESKGSVCAGTDRIRGSNHSHRHCASANTP